MIFFEILNIILMKIEEIRSYCTDYYAEAIYAFGLISFQGKYLNQIAEYSMEAGALCEGNRYRFQELYSLIEQLRYKLSNGNEDIDQRLIKFQNAISRAAQNYWQLNNFE